MPGLVLLPGLLAAGIGALVFLGLNAWTGLGTFSLAIPRAAAFQPSQPRRVRLGPGHRGGGRAGGHGNPVAGTALAPLRRAADAAGRSARGLVVAALAILYAQSTGKASSDVLFPGQSALPHLIQHASSYTVWALLLLLVCKGVAYGVSLSSFRGGPIFPAMFIGAAGGIAMSHLPGLPVVAGVAMGIGAMSAVMLTLPLTSVLLPSLLLLSDGLAVMPLVIVAVIVAYVAAARIAPAPAAKDSPAAQPSPGARSEGGAAPAATGTPGQRSRAN